MQIEFEGQTLECNDDETVLDALLRHGHAIPHGCCSGICQACKMISTDENFCDEPSQRGLNEAQRQLGHFLSCQCRPQSPIAIRRLDFADDKIPATIVDINQLNENVIGLRLQTAVRFTPGQYVTLWKNENVARSYSIANLNNPNSEMEFHIKVLPNGEFSQWLATTANIGDTLMLQGPFGSCIYSGDAEQTMLLAATGTGLAPILGIARDALAQQHSGDIQLVVAANSADDLYLVDELKALAASHEQIKLHFVLRNAKQTNSTLEAEADDATVYDAMFNADVYAWCKQQWPTLKGWRIFLCGNTSFVGKMRKQCFMSGANMRDISSDIFLPFGQPMA